MSLSIYGALLAWSSGPGPFRMVKSPAFQSQRPALLMEASAEKTNKIFEPPAPMNTDLGSVVTCVVLGKVKVEAPTDGQNREGLRVTGYSVDIGLDEPAFVPRNHVALRPNATGANRRGGNTSVWSPSTGFDDLPSGLVLEGVVIGVNSEGAVNVSLARHQNNVAWARVSQLMAEDVTIAARLLRFSDAGATLDIEGLPAFLPWSHWSLPEDQRTTDRHGSTVFVKFLEAEKERRRLVVSNRRVKFEEALTAIEPGSIVEGVVKDVKEFGAIVSLAGGFEGLLHVSQVSQVFVQSPADCLKNGDSVRCVVIRVDADDGSIALSTKMLEGTPGAMLKNATAVYEKSRAAATSQE